ncbi:MAG: WecB/TagA/CpsF family glycosyltransferase [Sedimentisphaerales bacterium]|nr:WecB/TagA/CpsF family glycosyltransferase [Sedimentisphaerales bacterium]
MKILLVHNRYGVYSGEEAVVDAQQRLLREHGHEVIRFERSSAELETMRFGKLRAFLAGIYNPFSRRTMRRLLKEYRPDVVHIHNLYPLISPSVLAPCRRGGVPVVMTVHNYRLFCPNGSLQVKGRICRRCGGEKEYWCLFNNCMGSLPKSLGYFLRNWLARKRGMYKKNVTLYVCLTQFQKELLIREGFPPDRISVAPNMVSAQREKIMTEGNYIGFAGRLNQEKGIWTLMQAARQTPQISYKAAGDSLHLSALRAAAPANFELLGRLAAGPMKEFYEHCRFLVLPSEWFEGFPVVLLEAMKHGKAVVASRLGGIPEIVEDGRTGLLFEPGNAQDLTEKIKALWTQPALCRSMGKAGRRKFIEEYSPQRYYERLIRLYAEVVSPGRERSGIFTEIKTGKNKTVPSVSTGAILGVRFNLTSADQAVQTVLQWKRRRQQEMIIFAPPHSVVMARRDRLMRTALAKAALVLPDGVGIILAAKILGYDHFGRVTGPDFMLELCDKGRQVALKHYFYGGAPGVAEKLIKVLCNKYPGLNVGGYFCPPFRELSICEDDQVIRTINKARPDILWIGLGAPKQEKWMLEHYRKIHVTAMLGVGAAFDFHSGQVKWAPRLFRSLGLEWAWRLTRQPQRMFKRNLDSPRFLLQILHQRFSAGNAS